MLEKSELNLIESNIVRDNQYDGICLKSSEENVLYGNELIDNRNDAADDGFNQWYPSEKCKARCTGR